MLGPEAGTADPEARTAVPVVYDGTRVADLAADRCGDRALLGGVAELVALQCLVGWDTGGVPWDDDRVTAPPPRATPARCAASPRPGRSTFVAAGAAGLALRVWTYGNAPASRTRTRPSSA